MAFGTIFGISVFFNFFLIFGNSQKDCFLSYTNHSKRESVLLRYSAGSNNTGNRNTFVGYEAGYSNTDKEDNSFVGYKAGYSNIKGGGNTFNGSLAGYKNTLGTDNTFLGFKTGYNNIKGNANVFLGYFSGYNNKMGGHNTFLGNYSGYENTKGKGNTFIGSDAGLNNTTGINNTFLGREAGLYSTAGSHNIFIGYEIGPSSGDQLKGITPRGDYQLNIGNLIIGKMPEQRISLPSLSSPGVVIYGDLKVQGSIESLDSKFQYEKPSFLTLKTQVEKFRAEIEKTISKNSIRLNELKKELEITQKELNSYKEKIKRIENKIPI